MLAFEGRSEELSGILFIDRSEVFYGDTSWLYGELYELVGPIGEMAMSSRSCERLET